MNWVLLIYRNQSTDVMTSEGVLTDAMDDCNVDRTNTLTFKIILSMGVVFVIVSALISLFINKVDRKKLLSKSHLS